MTFYSFGWYHVSYIKCGGSITFTVNDVLIFVIYLIYLFLLCLRIVMLIFQIDVSHDLSRFIADVDYKQLVIEAI